MNLESLVGCSILSIELNKNELQIHTLNGIIKACIIDSGTMRDPEPSFHVRVLPLNHCKEWYGFDRCGEELPCKIHRNDDAKTTR